MKSKPNIKILIIGHTDNTGNPQRNQKLSEARAESLAAYLIAQNINKDRIKTQGKGDTMPVATNGTEEGRRWNRRTEVFLSN